VISRKALVGLLTGLAHPWALPVFALWVGAIVCAFVFKKRFRNEDRALNEDQVKASRRLYFASTAVGYLMTLVFFLSFTHWGCAMFAADESRCERNVRALAKAVQAYAVDNDDTLPGALPWSQTLAQYIQPDGQILRCPYADGPHSYAYNAAFASVKLSTISEPGSSVVIFESRTTDVGKEPVLDVDRHGGKLFVGLADGHAKRHVGEGKLFWSPRLATDIKQQPSRP